MARKKKERHPQVVNLLTTEKWGEAYPLFKIMMKQIGPQIRRLPLQDLLFLAYLTGIHNVVDAQERVKEG